MNHNWELIHSLDLPVPDHTTFSRRSADLEVASALVSTDLPVTVVIDLDMPATRKAA